MGIQGNRDRRISRKRFLGLGGMSAAALALGDTGAALAQRVTGTRPIVTHGVQSGDVTASNAIVWARADRPSRMLYRRFERSENPFVYTPGDNEWTDCHRPPNPSPEEADPLNRLALVRQTFFSDDYSLARKEIGLQRQSEDYPENARWRYGDVTFATLHVVGSNNNRPTAANPAVGNEEEWRARNEANIAWLTETFDAAEREGSAVVMLVIQANIFEGDTAQPSGFAEFRDALRRETITFGKPVVLVHGDSHYFRIDKPLYTEEGSRVLNFTRVETFGEKDVHWVRATVDTGDPEVFSFQPEIVAENVE